MLIYLHERDAHRDAKHEGMEMNSQILYEVAAILSEVGMTHQPDNSSSHSEGLFTWQTKMRRGYFLIGGEGCEFSMSHYYLPNHSFCFTDDDRNPVQFAREFVKHIRNWAEANQGWQEAQIVLGLVAAN